MKLKHCHWLGRFYELNGALGWMPWLETIILMLNEDKLPDGFKWVSRSDVKFS